MMGAMGIFWSVTVGMMHPVQDRIGSGRQIGAPLTNPCEKVKKSFPKFAHVEHLVGSISM